MIQLRSHMNAKLLSDIKGYKPWWDICWNVFSIAKEFDHNSYVYRWLLCTCTLGIPGWQAGVVTAEVTSPWPCLQSVTRGPPHSWPTKPHLWVRGTGCRIVLTKWHPAKWYNSDPLSYRGSEIKAHPCILVQHPPMGQGTKWWRHRLHTSVRLSINPSIHPPYPSIHPSIYPPIYCKRTHTRKNACVVDVRRESVMTKVQYSRCCRP